MLLQAVVLYSYGCSSGDDWSSLLAASKEILERGSRRAVKANPPDLVDAVDEVAADAGKAAVRRVLVDLVGYAVERLEVVGCSHLHLLWPCLVRHFHLIGKEDATPVCLVCGVEIKHFHEVPAFFAAGQVVDELLGVAVLDDVGESQRGWDDVLEAVVITPVVRQLKDVAAHFERDDGGAAVVRVVDVDAVGDAY